MILASYLLRHAFRVAGKNSQSKSCELADDNHYRGDKEVDPWKDPLEGDEWDGLRWFIYLCAWWRRLGSNK